MRQSPGQSPGLPNPQSGQVKPESRERALIIAALNQLDRASTWTSQVRSWSDAPTIPEGSDSDPISADAPTVADPSVHSEPVTHDLPTKDAFPGYDILREIHRGGQGVVYLATQLNTKRRVAVKVMHGGSTLGSSGRVRFEREVQLLGQLNHPNIVKLHDSGVTSDGSFFYVMDYVSGRALDEVLREHRRKLRNPSTLSKSRSRSRAEGIEDIQSTLLFFAKICDGVNAAHLKGVIHRDIKPANVRVDQSGEPVLVDFGLAKVTAGVETDLDPSNPMTMTGQFIGSLPWASPEQAVGSGDAIDLRSDVYSLGVMLYQMLTGGEFPYQVIGNMRDVLDNIQRADPARPSTVRKQINDEVETIVLKALAKEKERRYQSAGELARDIRRYINGEPIEAKRDAGWYVIRKTLNRHKVAMTFAATIAVLVTGSAIGMTGMWRQAEGARVVAVTERDRAEENLRAVRDLSQTFLYDFNDSIANLRGANRAREIVLAKALQYLTMLAAQPDQDADAINDLADAHERVGDLYGAIYAANTGTTEQAIEHYNEALALRTSLVADYPGDALYRARLAGTWERVGESRFKQEDFSGALDAYSAGIDLATQAGDTPVRLAILTRAADVHKRMAVEAAANQPLFDQRTSMALSMYEQASDGWSQITNPEAPRRRAILLSKTAQTLLLQGKVAEDHRGDTATAQELNRLGNEMIREAIARFEQLRLLNPADYLLARDLWVVRHYYAQSRFDAATVLTSLGQDDQALQARTEALDQFLLLRDLAESLAMDQSNLEAQRDLATTMNKLGNTLRELGRLNEARDIFSTNVVRWQSLYQSDPVERHLRDLGVGQYKVAEVDEQIALEAATTAERLAMLRLSRSGYESALETFRQYGNRGGPAEGISDTVRQSIARVDGYLADG